MVRDARGALAVSIHSMCATSKLPYNEQCFVCSSQARAAIAIFTSVSADCRQVRAVHRENCAMARQAMCTWHSHDIRPREISEAAVIAGTEYNRPTSAPLGSPNN